MADVGPLLRLYGVADSVFAEPPAREVPPALESWLPLNARPDAVGWYDRARRALELRGRDITAADRIDVTGEALLETQEQQADDPLQPNHVLHAVTAVARALPDEFAPEGELRDGGIGAVDAVLRSLARSPEDEGVAERVLDAFRVPDDNNAIFVEQWAAALEAAGLTDTAELQEPPCNDEITDAKVEGYATPATKLTTEYQVDGVTLESACKHFLDPSRWPTCAKSLWVEMNPCDGASESNGVVAQSYLEVVQIDGVPITTCLTFHIAANPDEKECELAYDLCDAATVEECGAGDGRVTVDHGYIVVTEANGGVNVKTVKTLRFQPPLDGIGAAMLACAVGYGPAGYAMALDCSKEK